MKERTLRKTEISCDNILNHRSLSFSSTNEILFVTTRFKTFVTDIMYIFGLYTQLSKSSANLEEKALDF